MWVIQKARLAQCQTVRLSLKRSGEDCPFNAQAVAMCDGHNFN